MLTLRDRLGWCSFVLLLVTLATGCVGYARSSGRESYRQPGGIPDLERYRGRPVVLLITGSMIVSRFYDVMEDRLRERGFLPVVYQPPDLFTEPLVDGAARIDEAVQATLRATGVRQLSIIAECNGGIAARYYLQHRGGDRFVDRLVTFVSAHHGTDYFSIHWYPALGDIEPDSEFMLRANVPMAMPGHAMLISIYLCDDEIMDPMESPRIPGAINVRVCDAGFDQRARERQPYDVGHFLGNHLIASYPIHLGGFWDEPFFALLQTALRDDPSSLVQFRSLAIYVEDDRFPATHPPQAPAPPHNSERQPPDPAASSMQP